MKNIFSAIEKKPIPVVIGLMLFHIALAGLMSWIAHSSFLSHLHNGQGFWNFATDATFYHLEASQLANFLNSGNWSDWWAGKYTDHFSNDQIARAHTPWIAFVYWVFGWKVPLLFEFINSTAWVTSVVLIYFATRIIFAQNILVAGFSVSFLFFPSILLSSTQLLKDIFYILGICFVISGWTMIFHKDYNWKGVLAIIIGFFLIASIREYVTALLWSTFFICTLIFILRKSITPLPALIMLIGISILPLQKGFYNLPEIGLLENNDSSVASSKIIKKESTRSFLKLAEEIWAISGENSLKEVIKGLDNNKEESLQHQIALKQLNIINTSNYDGVEGFIRYLNNQVVIKISIMRFGFNYVNKSANSRIDTDIQFMNIRELITYLPRALQIGFLSPFPSLWFSKGSETGYIGRMLVGIETLIIYVVFIGFFSTLFIEIKVLKPLIPILIFSGIFIVLLGLVVPNVGAIYRMRQGLLIPFLMAGIYGWRLLFIKLTSKFLVSKYCKSQ
jgi:hypothetical protein